MTTSGSHKGLQPYVRYRAIWCTTVAFGQLLAGLVGERGIGILMIEHDMSLVLNICNWIQVLDFGRPLMAGTPDEVCNSEEVRAAYLGQSAA